jgi:HPt (histidine-containing phosphotransfer) domain-containing protein
MRQDPFSGKDEAISRLGGLENLYYKYVKRFQISYSDSDEVLLHLIEMKRYDEARIFVHSLKGLTATLGMKELQQRSASIESAILEDRFDDLPLLICYFGNSLSRVIQSKIFQSSSSEGT